MLDLDTLIRRLPATPEGAALLAGFVPPPRFTGKRFADYVPDARYPSQAAARERLQALAAELSRAAAAGWRRRLSAWLGGGPRGGGVYLDGGFGVGKTHLLAALWNAAPGPKAYLSFDELVYTLGLLGVAETHAAFRAQRLVCVDEWELDDPGNLKLALAFLRGALADGVRVVATSNTLPLELGEGRFSQKDFAREVEELARAFEVVRLDGEDFRHRHFEAAPAGERYFLSAPALRRRAAAAGARAPLVSWPALLDGLAQLHPIRYADLVAGFDALFLEHVAPFAQLPEALRFVHFVDKLYDSGASLAASAAAPLGALFPESFIAGAYGKKFSRCLSRLEELLSETPSAPAATPPPGAQAAARSRTASGRLLS